MDDEANLVFGQKLGEIVRAHRVGAVAIPGRETCGQVVSSVRFHSGAVGDGYPALAFTHGDGDDDRGAGIASHPPHLHRVRAREQLDRAVGSGLETPLRRLVVLASLPLAEPGLPGLPVSSVSLLDSEDVIVMS